MDLKEREEGAEEAERSALLFHEISLSARFISTKEEEEKEKNKKRKEKKNDRPTAPDITETSE